jgi:hypothetical protein
MKRVSVVVVWLILFAAFCALCACAQNTISVVSAFPHDRQLPVPVSCQTQADLLLQTLQRYPHPANWHWILLCDDAAWNHLLVHIDHAGDRVYAVTDLEGGTTCVRGTTLLRPDQPQASPGHVIAHELAHIMLRTPDEDQAEQLTRRWLRECHQVSSENGNCLVPTRTGL